MMSFARNLHRIHGQVRSHNRRRIGMVTFGRAVNIAVSFSLGVVLAQTLPVGSRGAYATAITLASLASISAGAGMDIALLKMTSMPQYVRPALRITYRRVAVVLCVVSVGVALALGTDMRILALSTRELITAVVAIPFILGVQLIGNCFIGTGNMRAWLAISTGVLLINLVAVSAVAAVGRSSASCYLAVFLGSYLAAFAVAVALAQRAAPRSIGHQRGTEKAILSEARSTTLITLTQAFFLRIPLPLLAGISTAEQVGLVSVALPLAEILLILPVAAGTVLVGAYTKTTPSAARVAATARRVGITTAALALVVATLSYVLVPVIYGDEYSGARLTILVLLPGMALFAYSRVLQSFLISSADHRGVLLASVAGLGSCVIGTATVGGVYGALGTGVAITTGCAVTAIVVVARFRRLLVSPRGQVRAA